MKHHRRHKRRAVEIFRATPIDELVVWSVAPCCSKLAEERSIHDDVNLFTEAA
jgi:hypothetical protein